MATFLELKTIVSSRLLDANNTVVSSGDVGLAINAAQEFWKNERFWFNEKTDTLTLTIDNPVVDVGSLDPDFLFELERDGFVIVDDRRYPLEKIDPEQYDSMNLEETDRPQYYTYRSGQYEVYPYPDQAYDLVVRYVRDYADFENTGDTNDFSIYAKWLIVYDALSRLHVEFRQDEKMGAMFAAGAESEAKKLKQRSNNQARTGVLAVETIL